MKDNRKTSLTDTDRAIIEGQVRIVTSQYYDKWLEVMKSRPEVRAALSRVEAELTSLARKYEDLLKEVPYVDEYHQWMYANKGKTTETVHIYQYTFQVQLPHVGVWQIKETRFLNTEDCRHLPELQGSIEEHKRVLDAAMGECNLVRTVISDMMKATRSIRVINNVLPQLATMSPHFAGLVAQAPPVKRQRKLKDEEVLRFLDTPEFRAALGKMLISKE